MSTTTVIEQTGNKIVANHDVSKFLLGFNSFISVSHTAPGGGSVLTEGLIMGRIAATGKVVELDHTAVDGSQIPVGVLIAAKTVAGAATVDLNLVNKGKVAESKLTFKAGTTLASEIDGRQLRDWLNDIGLELTGGEELTKVDNQ